MSYENNNNNIMYIGTCTRSNTRAKRKKYILSYVETMTFWLIEFGLIIINKKKKRGIYDYMRRILILN